MKIKRHKKFQKTVKFFIKNFDWKPPFNLLIDGTFAKVALDNKVNLRDQLPKYFDNPVKLFTTPCCLVETEKLGPELYGALQVLKTFHVHKCPHAERPVCATKCIKFMAKREHAQQHVKVHWKENKNESAATILNLEDKPKEIEMVRYIPATQDLILRKYLREISGIPLIYLNGPAPAFEKPSKSTQESAELKNAKKLEVSGYQKEILNKMKDEVFGQVQAKERKGTIKRKRSGPNPLSCKKSKKKKKLASSGGPTSTTPKDLPLIAAAKKRRRNRLPKHVKEELSKIKQHDINIFSYNTSQS